MHRLNPEKLLHSKWTASQPQQRERHFMVTALYRDELEQVQAVELEAVLTKRSQRIDWHHLKDAERWHMGWR
ncbi:MAG: TIGR02450 family Trp-rich protein [Pseudomonadaceae bacterium]|nr:MAG: TIGR02450 family Trp-rich protein [Pseudomonadaceae bacterium]